MTSSQIVWDLLRIHYDLPEHVTKATIRLSHKTPAEIEVTMNVWENGSFVIEDDEVVSVTKKYKLVEVD